MHVNVTKPQAVNKQPNPSPVFSFYSQVMRVELAWPLSRWKKTMNLTERNSFSTWPISCHPMPGRAFCEYRWDPLSVSFASLRDPGLWAGSPLPLVVTFTKFSQPFQEAQKEALCLHKKAKNIRKDNTQKPNPNPFLSKVTGWLIQR